MTKEKIFVTLIIYFVIYYILNLIVGFVCFMIDPCECWFCYLRFVKYHVVRICSYFIIILYYYPGDNEVGLYLNFL